MKKIFVLFVCAFMSGVAFAAGENVATSKAFVDAAVAQKQDIIPANSGTDQVLTNTGTTGTVGTKDIYSASNEYVNQMDSLVTADTMNAAVQTAIEAEFKCIKWVDDDPTKDCLLVNIFSAPARSVLPTGYTALEYLESTGTQYIRTGIYADSDTGISGRYAFTAVHSYNHIFGSFAPHYYFGMTSNAGLLAVSYGADAGSSVLSIPISDFHINEIYGLDLNFLNSGTVSLAGIKSADLPHRTFSHTGNEILLFANTDSIKAHGRNYGTKISQGNSVVRDFIPARRNSDGVLGMYDLVTGTFFTKNGTGEFVAGPDANNVYLPSM